MKLAKLCVLSTIIATFSGTAPAAAQGQTAPAAGTQRAEGTLQRQDGQGGGRGPGARGGAVAGRPTLTAVRTAQAPNIDGHLDDALWLSAALIDTFVQEEPVEGAPATERTEVRIARTSSMSTPWMETCGDSASSTGTRARIGCSLR